MLTTMTAAAVSRGCPISRAAIGAPERKRRITAAPGQRISAETWNARISSTPSASRSAIGASWKNTIGRGMRAAGWR